MLAPNVVRVPLLSLGIPGSNSAAVLLGGLLIHGLTPGPLLFERNPDVAYGLYGGLLVANIAMVLIGLVILTPCLWLVNRPKPWLIAFILFHTMAIWLPLIRGKTPAAA